MIVWEKERPLSMGGKSGLGKQFSSKKRVGKITIKGWGGGGVSPMPNKGEGLTPNRNFSEKIVELKKTGGRMGTQKKVNICGG